MPDSYNETQWKTGDVIDATGLNNAESGIFSANKSAYMANIGNHMPVMYLDGSLNGMSGDVKKVLHFTYVDGLRKLAGYAKVKWQGDSSQNYLKKNFKIKLYSDENCEIKLNFSPQTSWDKDNKFNLKANFIDATHSRNIVNSRIWADMVSSRQFNPNASPNYNYIPDANFEKPLFDTWGKGSVPIIIDKEHKIDGYSTLYKPSSSVGVGGWGALNAALRLVADNTPVNYWIKANAGDVITFVADADIVKNPTTKAFVGNPITLSVFGLDSSLKRIKNTNYSVTNVADGKRTHIKFHYTVPDGIEYISSCFFGMGDAEFYIGKMGTYKNVSAEPKPYQINQKELAYKINNTAFRGSVDGFPISLYLNGVSFGLYTFNTAKSEKMWNLNSDKNKMNIAISGNKGNRRTGSLLQTTSDNLDWVNYGLETDQDPDQDVKNAFNSLLKYINTASDDDFKKNAGNYIDIASVIDFYIFAMVTGNYDSWTKSYVLYTYNGVFWSMGAYDNDSTWGLYFDGSKLEAFSDIFNPDNINNVLVNRIVKTFPDDVKNRYGSLRKNLLSPDAIVKKFSDFIGSINTEDYEADQALWPDIPSTDINNLKQIQDTVVRYIDYTDRLIGGGEYV